MLRLLPWLTLLLCMSAGAAPIPAKDFFRHAEYGDARISPTGRYLAVKLPTENATGLAIVDLVANKVSAAFQVDSRTHAAWFEWVSDERVVFSVDYKDGSLDRPVPTDRLYAGNADGSKRVRILGGDSWVRRGFRVVSTLPDDERHILVQVANAAFYHDLYRVDVYTGRKTPLGRSPVRHGEFTADSSGQPRLVAGTTPEADAVVMLRADEDADWQEIARYGPTEAGIYPLRFMPDDRRVLVASTRHSPQARLAVLDPADGKLDDLVADPRYDVMSAFGAEVGLDRLLLARDGETPIGVAFETDKPQLRFFEPVHPDAAIYKGLAEAFAGQRIRFGNFTRDGTRLLLRVESDRNPGDFYLFDTGQREVKYLFSARRWIDPGAMRPMRSITVTARDGLELPGYLTLPAGTEEKPPLIVLPHGGPHGPRDYWEWLPEVQFFAHHGFAVLQLNFRGSGGLGRDFQSAGYRRWGREMQDDVTDATRWAIEQGFADPRRICIFGGSYGGYAAMMGVIREPALYRCGASNAGVYDIEMMFEKADYLQFDRETSKAVMRLFHGTDEKDWAARSPLSHVDAIRVPLFLAAGGKDQRVPIEHHERLTEALDDAGKPYEALVKPREGHGFYDEDNRVELYERLLAFFRANTGP